MFERFGYKSALYLSASIAVVHCCFFWYALNYWPNVSNRIAIYLVFAVAVCIGLWLASKMARYVGAALYLLSAVAAVLPLFDFEKKIVMSVGSLWVVTMGTLSLAAASILVFSKPFAREFAAELSKQPTYKKHLLNVFVVAIVLSAVVATLNDIVNLASN